MLGAAFDIEDISIDVGDGASGSSDRYMIVTTLAKLYGDNRQSASLSGGRGDYTLTRQVMTPGGSRTVSGTPDTTYVAAQLATEREYGFGPDERPGFLRPSLAVGVIHQWQDAYSETGAGDYEARVEKAQQTFATLHPAIEIGGRMPRGESVWMPYARAGGLAIFGDADDLDATLNSLPYSGPSFSVGQEVPGSLADFGVGLEVQHGGLSVQVGGAALLAGSQQVWSANARMVWAF